MAEGDTQGGAKSKPVRIAVGSPPTEADKLSNLIVSLTALGPLFAVYLYFLGLSYEYALFYYLGLSLSSVEIPLNYTLVYSYGALIQMTFWNFVLWILLIAAVGLLLFAGR